MTSISPSVDYRPRGVLSSAPRRPPDFPGISLDHQILLTGVRIHLGSEAIERMQELVDDSTLIDWQGLIATARHNGLIPILYHVLKRCNSIDLQEPLDLLRAHVRVMALFNQGLLQELTSLLQKCQEQQLNILAYKGPTLALAAYGDLSLRQSGDLDFLVASDSFEGASQFLQRQGYGIHAEHLWAKCLRHQASQVELDLHQNVAGLYLPFQMNFQDIWARRHQTTLAGISLNYPCPEDMVVLLCVQFAKDAHDNQRKLIKACDIAAVINGSSLDWDLILEIAQQCKGDRPLKLGLSIVEGLFGLPLTPRLHTYAHSDWVMEQYRQRIGKELFTPRSAHRSIPGLFWRALFLFQAPVSKWPYNWRLMKLFMYSVVNRTRKQWTNPGLR